MADVVHFPVTRGFGDRPVDHAAQFDRKPLLGISRASDEAAQTTQMASRVRTVTALAQLDRGIEMAVTAIEHLAYELPDAELQAYELHTLHAELVANYAVRIKTLMYEHGALLAVPPDGDAP